MDTGLMSFEMVDHHFNGIIKADFLSENALLRINRHNSVDITVGFCYSSFWFMSVRNPLLMIQGGDRMIEIEGDKRFLSGSQGFILLRDDDEITVKLAMLFEGECEGMGAAKAAKKFGYTRQRYHQLLQQFKSQGAEALKSKKRGPKGNYRRTDEVIRQIIRHRFLDSKASAGVIAQRLVQCGYPIAIRSVERVISEYGLQKKLHLCQPGKGQVEIEAHRTKEKIRPEQCDPQSI